MFGKKKDKVYWKSTKKELTEDQKKAFGWVIRIMKKKPEECADYEKEVQKIYKNTLIF